MCTVPFLIELFSELNQPEFDEIKLMNELPEIGSMLYTCVQRVLGSPGGKHCKSL